MHRHLISIAIAVSFSTAFASDLPTSSPEAQGIDSAQLNAALKDIQASGVAVDSILIMRNGYVVLDSYFYPYQPNTQHPLFSVTKSVTSSALGISIQQGKLKGLDQAIGPFFTKEMKGDIDPRKAAITLGNLVDMHSGIAWYALTPNDPESSNNQVLRSKNWQQFVLQQKMDDKPGRTFSYNNGNYQLLSSVIEQAWGRSMQEVVQEQLFKPLGIQQFTWGKDPQGHTVGSTDLALTPRDLARLGQFWLQDGVWEGQRILPTGWTANLFKDTREAQSAGYRRGFWVNLGQQYFQAEGSLGQFVRIDPKQQLIIVMTGKIPDQELNVNAPNQLHQLAKSSVPLPANPAAEAELATTVLALGSPPKTTNTREIGQEWYNKTWRFAAKPWGIDAINLKPDPKDAGALIWEVDWSTTWTKDKNIWPVGIDGAYRSKPDPSANNLKLHARARWLNSNTLELKTTYNEGFIYWKYTFIFNKNNVELSYADNDFNSGQATGQLVKP